jgi:hypothetical protein
MKVYQLNFQQKIVLMGWQTALEVKLEILNPQSANKIKRVTCPLFQYKI